MKNLESLIKTYNDFPQKGIAFKDILEIMHDPEVFRELIRKMSSNKVIKSSEAIISIEARGFIFGSAISLQTSKPMVVARKPGKLPNETFQKSFNLEYGSTSIEIQKNTNIMKGQKIVIVDDLVATGGTAIACAELLTENFNVSNQDILILSIIDLTELGGSKLIKEKGFSIKTLVDYD